MLNVPISHNMLYMKAIRLPILCYYNPQLLFFVGADLLVRFIITSVNLFYHERKPFFSSAHTFFITIKNAPHLLLAFPHDALRRLISDLQWHLFVISCKITNLHSPFIFSPFRPSASSFSYHDVCSKDALTCTPPIGIQKYPIRRVETPNRVCSSMCAPQGGERA